MGFQFTRKLTIEWGHCDPAGIVFNPRFFEFFDWSTALLLQAALGMPKTELLAAYGIVGIPLVDTKANFLRAVAIRRRNRDRSTRDRCRALELRDRPQDCSTRDAWRSRAQEKRVWTIRD